MARTQAALDFDDILAIWNGVLAQMQLPAETPDAPPEATTVMRYPKGAGATKGTNRLSSSFLAAPFGDLMTVVASGGASWVSAGNCIWARTPFQIARMSSKSSAACVLAITPPVFGLQVVYLCRYPLPLGAIGTILGLARYVTTKWSPRSNAGTSTTLATFRLTACWRPPGPRSDYYHGHGSAALPGGAGQLREAGDGGEAVRRVRGGVVAGGGGAGRSLRAPAYRRGARMLP